MFCKQMLPAVVLTAAVVAIVSIWTVSAEPQSFQYNCIDQNGKIGQCPGNRKPDKFDNDLVAYSKYSNRINETGWAELQMVTNGAVEDRSQAYYAGFLEGSLTSRLIDSFVYNIYGNNSNANCMENYALIKTNLDWILANVKQTEQQNANQAKDEKKNAYWKEVGNLFYQMAGLEDGYRSAMNNKGNGNSATPKPHLNIEPCSTMMMLNLYFELEELRNIMNVTGSEVSVRSGSRCSAIVKVMPGLKDIAIAHNTWGNPKTMLRIMKRYEFNFSTSKASTIVMTSYPGNVFSSDDYYITSQKMVLQETTNENYNFELYWKMQTRRFVFEFARNMVANRLATNGAEWTNIFADHNSGTYNNQFMVLDYKRFKPGHPIQSGVLTILEQLPTLIQIEDLSHVLAEQTYWPSFNVPYFDLMQNQSGYRALSVTKGDFYSHEKCPRSKILRRDHSKVTNMSSLFHLMRYNGVLTDPLSRCEGCDSLYSPGYTISSRFDLPDLSGTYPSKDHRLRSWAAIDAKMTNYQLVMDDLQMVAVSGPTDQDVPAFNWATTKLANVSHRDQPTVWNFKPILAKWKPETVFSNIEL